MTTGGCHCGRVRYKATGQPEWSVGCCCRDCTRLAGAPFVVMVGFAPEQVAFETAPDYCETSPGVIRGACPSCHTQVTYGRAKGFEAGSPLLYLMAASFDDPEAHPPQEVVWYASRPSWLELRTDIPLHDGVSDVNAARSYATVVAQKERDNDEGERTA